MCTKYQVKKKVLIWYIPYLYLLDHFDKFIPCQNHVIPGILFMLKLPKNPGIKLGHHWSNHQVPGIYLVFKVLIPGIKRTKRYKKGIKKVECIPT